MKKFTFDKLPKLFITLLVIFSYLMGFNHVNAKTTKQLYEDGPQALIEGGHIILLRHAYAPRTEANGNNDKKYKHMVCSSQRDILSAGIKQSQAIGKWVIDNGINVEEVISSTTCRTWKTAKYAGWDYTLNEDVRNVRGSNEMARRVQVLRDIILGWHGVGNLVVVTHAKMINRLFPGVIAISGEMIITDGTTIGDKNQYFKTIGRINFAYDGRNKE